MAVAAPRPPRTPRLLKPAKRKVQWWLLVGLLVLVLGVVIVSVLGAGPGACDASTPPSETAETTIPAELMSLYLRAERQYGVPWSVLASINSIESAFGRNLGPSSAGARGPMQFIPSTWAAYGVDGNGDGRKDINDPEDAIPAAARYLKASGAPQDMQRAIFAYNHAQWYVDKVLALAQTFAAGDALIGTVACADSAPSAGGGAELQQAVTLRSPRAFRALPRDLVAAGFRPVQEVDARIWPNAIYLLRTYHLKVTAAREAGHETHGDGTALDIAPAGGNSQAIWDASVGRMAADLGWTSGCARSGVRPACSFVPAIHAVFYDGYPGHGSPRTCQGGCPQHIHLSWVSDTYGTGGLGPPPGFVRVFPVPVGLAAPAPG